MPAPGRPAALCLGLLVLSGLLGPASAAYPGFDCSQGSALLSLASHRCSSEAHQHALSCFNSVALRVRRCTVKAWPHPHKSHKRACWGVQLLANVTNVNHAHGTLRLPPRGRGGRAVVVPVQLEFRRPDEAMHVTFGPPPAPEPGAGAAGQQASCTLLFDVATATDASLRPVPGEDAGASSSLLALALPAILVPCLAVSLIVALGSLAGRGPHGPLKQDAASQYSPLASGPGGGDAGAGASSAGRSPFGYSSRDGGLGAGGPGGLGLLKAMSRRARSRRTRRSCRPVYVGRPELGAVQQRQYVEGRLEPGPFALVAPCFKFPPVAAPPGLDAIPEAPSPSRSSSQPASRASSAADLARTSPHLELEELLSGSGSPRACGLDPDISVDALLLSGAWMPATPPPPPQGDAEQGGFAASS